MWDDIGLGVQPQSPTWNIIEQAVNLVISDTVFLNLHYGDVENSADATVQENFKLLEKILL